MAKLKVIGRGELSECRGDQRDETTSPYTMTKADYIVVVQDGDCVVELPLAASCNGYDFYVKCLGPASLELKPSSKPVDPDVPEVTEQENVDGTSASWWLEDSNVLNLFSDGTEFFVLGSYG